MSGAPPYETGKPASGNSKMQLALDIADRIGELINSKVASPTRQDLCAGILEQMDCGQFQIEVTPRVSGGHRDGRVIVRVPMPPTVGRK